MVYDFVISQDGPLTINIKLESAERIHSMSVMLHRLTILLRIRELLGSNLGPEIDYPD
jgi:hypothetical protein